MADIRPLVAITIGDAAGIGPEVVVKALASEDIYHLSRPLVIGALPALQQAVALVARPLRLRQVTAASEAKGESGAIDFLDLANLSKDDLTYGRISAACGRAAMEFIEKAAKIAVNGEVRAIVTAPINKESTQRGGYADIGHLEFLARLTGSTQYATMLVSGALRAVHLTTHHPLIEACGLVTRERILNRLELTDECFRKWGFPQGPHRSRRPESTRRRGRAHGKRGNRRDHSRG